MLLKDMVENSNYVTDEELTDANIVGMANSAIAEINARCSTNLPLFVAENVSAIPYTALVGTWCLRMIEPYLSYSIGANDTDSNIRDFHYNRFLQAMNELKNNLSNAILQKDPTTGEPTGYAGASENMVPIDASDVTFNWGGWF